MSRLGSISLRLGKGLLSLLLGAAFSLSVYNYVLIRYLPATSKRALALALGLVLLGAGFHYFLLDRWIFPVLSRQRTSHRLWTVLLALVLGALCMLGGTEAVKDTPGNIIMLLPDRTVSITVSEDQRVYNPKIVLLFFETSAGEVPFSSIKYEGWTQKGVELVLTDFSNNSFRWTGKAGREASFVFQRSPQGGLLNVDWGGFSEWVNLQLDRNGKYLYKHEYPVPYYASGAVVLALAGLNFFVLSLALVLFVWIKRETIASVLVNSVQWTGDGAAAAAGLGAFPGKWLIIAALIGLALALRVYDLGDAYIYKDELSHLIAAKSILEGSPLTAVYQRGLFTVTLPVALFTKLFGINMWAAKLPGVLFNVLAIIPLFILMERVDRKVAIFSGILYATSPWIIAVSRSVREYAVYPFYFYWICLFMVWFIEVIPQSFVVVRDWRRVVKWRNALLALGLLLPPVYSIFIDTDSTFRIVLVAYVVFALFLAARFDLSNRSNRIFLGIAILLTSVMAVFFIMTESFVDYPDRVNLYPMRFFFPNPQQQWYFARAAVLFVLAFTMSIVVSVVVCRKNFIPLLLTALYLISIVVFTVFFDRFIRPRYLVNVQFWFIPLVGLGFYWIWSMLRVSFQHSRILALALGCLLLVTGFNGPQIAMASTYDEPGVMPVTDEYQYSFGAVDALLISEGQVGEVVVGSIYGAYALWKGSLPLEVISINSLYREEAQEYILTVVDGHESGWIVLDDRYNRGKWPLASFERGGRIVEYIGSLDGQLVWRWHLASGNQARQVTEKD